MVNSLRKVDFSHPTGHYAWKKLRTPPPLEKIPGAPLVVDAPEALRECLSPLDPPHTHGSAQNTSLRSRDTVREADLAELITPVSLSTVQWQRRVLSSLGSQPPATVSVSGLAVRDTSEAISVLTHRLTGGESTWRPGSAQIRPDSAWIQTFSAQI